MVAVAAAVFVLVAERVRVGYGEDVRLGRRVGVKEGAGVNVGEGFAGAGCDVAVDKRESGWIMDEGAREERGILQATRATARTGSKKIFVMCRMNIDVSSDDDFRIYIMIGSGS